MAPGTKWRPRTESSAKSPRSASGETVISGAGRSASVGVRVEAQRGLGRPRCVHGAHGGDQQAGLGLGPAVEELAGSADHLRRDGDLGPEAPVLVDLDDVGRPGTAVEGATGFRLRLLARLGLLLTLPALEHADPVGDLPGHERMRLRVDEPVPLHRGRLAVDEALARRHRDRGRRQQRSTGVERDRRGDHRGTPVEADVGGQHAPRWDATVELASPDVGHREDPVPDAEAAVVVDLGGGHGAEVAVDQAHGRAPALVDGDAGAGREAGCRSR